MCAAGRRQHRGRRNADESVDRPGPGVGLLRVHVPDCFVDHHCQTWDGDAAAKVLRIKATCFFLSLHSLLSPPATRFTAFCFGSDFHQPEDRKVHQDQNPPDCRLSACTREQKDYATLLLTLAYTSILLTLAYATLLLMLAYATLLLTLAYTSILPTVADATPLLTLTYILLTLAYTAIILTLP